MVATLCITEQKNSSKGACVHYGALEGQIFACPVKALKRLVAHIWVHTYNGTTLMCAYWDSVGMVDVTDRDISFHMKFSAKKLGYPIRNILLVSLHMPCLTGSNGRQSYLEGYYFWDNLILLLQIPHEK